MKKKLFYVINSILLIIASYIIFFKAGIPIPIGTAAGDPENFKIFYFHVPIAISSFVSFFIVFISSILYLRKKTQKWDIVALSGAEIGVILTGLTLASGSLWAKSAWQAYWVPWDVRLNSVLILFIIYLAYLMVRQAIEEPEKRARLSAVFGIIGFITVPISFFSVRFLAQMHPCVVPPCPSGGGGGIHGDVLVYFLINLAAYIMLVFSLLSYRIENEKIKLRLDEIKKL